MKLDIVIPSYHRLESLDKCIKSIFIAEQNIENQHTEVYVHLYLTDDGDLMHCAVKYRDIANVAVHLCTYRVPDFWNTHLAGTDADMVMTCNDDVEILPDTLNTIINQFQDKYPDFDGVLGLNQANLPADQALQSAFTVIGIKYADRFPERQVFCPAYDRFYGDKELGMYAESIGKFYYCAEAKIHHFHAAFYPERKDATHESVRTYLDGDKRKWRQRQAKGLLWGKTFEC